MTIAQHNTQIDQTIAGLTNSAVAQLKAVVNSLEELMINQPEGDLSAIAPLSLNVIQPVSSSDILPLLEDYSSTVELEPEAAVATALAEGVAAQITEDLRGIGQQLVSAVIIGALLNNSRTSILRSLRDILDTSRRGVVLLITESTMSAHGAYARRLAQAAGVEEYTYVGGTIATTRDFCRRHNNKTYTPQEIAKLWRGNWGGKRTGDPFVVRGGYNCRHYWVPTA